MGRLMDVVGVLLLVAAGVWFSPGLGLLVAGCGVLVLSWVWFGDDSGG